MFSVFVAELEKRIKENEARKLRVERENLERLQEDKKEGEEKIEGLDIEKLYHEDLEEVMKNLSVGP